MKSFINISLSVVLTGSLIATSFQANAGNPERALIKLEHLNY